MALYHFSKSQVKRSTGHSVVAAAAYRSGERLVSEYDGRVHDYRRKAGVVFSEILLPENAPAEYADRSTLWNSVEMFEKRKDAQLAHSFDIALQNEFSMEENVALARQFLQENFIARGMIVDYAIHMPDKENGISNPHFHVLCPIRPLNPDGTWGAKRKTEIYEDEDGEQHTRCVYSTDWYAVETLEAWRKAWAELCNAAFERHGMPQRIDHRSFEKQGLDLIPTVHEGPLIRAMEERGVRTNKGNLNRWIRATNAMIRRLFERLAELKEWIVSHRDAIREEKQNSLSTLISEFYADRHMVSVLRGYHKASKKDREDQTRIELYLAEHHLVNGDDLEKQIDAVTTAADGIRTQITTLDAQIKTLTSALDMADLYNATKPVWEAYNAIKFKKRQEKFRAEHDPELRQFQMARRKLREALGEKIDVTPDAIHKMNIGLSRFQGERSHAFEELQPLKEEERMLSEIRRKVDSALKLREESPQEREERYGKSAEKKKIQR